MADSVLCVGEVLWDALPAGLFLGGAPFNVACHLHQLGQDVVMASRVGDDVLGREVLRRVRARGMDPSALQVDPTRRTGFVEVELDAAGAPAYTIIEPVAWDAIELTEDLAARAAQATAVVVGSLAQRRRRSRETIQAMWETDGQVVFDLNLRPPFVERAVVERSLRAADIVKMNDEELAQMVGWFDLPSEPRAAVDMLADIVGAALVCVTRGPHGAVLWHEGAWTEHPGYRVTVADTVGAGDAFLAGLLARHLAGQPDADVLDGAARLGAYVATQMGPTPVYDALDALPRPARNPAPPPWTLTAS